MTSRMTSRERWLAAVRMQPVDRLPFWPKLDAAYTRMQRKPFKNMTPDQIHDWIGSDNHVWGIPKIIKESRAISSIDITEKNGIQKTVYRFRREHMQALQVWDVPSQSWVPYEFPVKNRHDVILMTELFRDCQIELDKENLETAQSIQDSLGDSGVTQCSMGKSPLMLFVELLAGIENAHYLLSDYTKEVEDLFDAVQENLIQVVKIYAENSPTDFLYFTENTSTTLISPGQFRKYCFRHIAEYSRVLKGNNRFFVLHMCGHLKSLLADLANLNVDAFEAFTSPPVGNTTLANGRKACPEKCLIGGTNASLWMQKADDIISELERDLAELPHHRGIVITSAGVMPPLCSPETIRKVGDWVKQYEVV